MSDLFDKSIRTLELPRVLELLSEQAVSAEAKQRALRLRPETEPEEVLRLLDQTDAARNLIGLRGSPSFSGVKPVAEALDRADRGGALNTRELLTIADLLTAAPCGRPRPRAARSFKRSSPPPAMGKFCRRPSSPSGTAASWCR